MKALKKVGKWLLYMIGGVVAFAVVVLITIRINSSGEEEPFLDEDGEIVANSIAIHENIDVNGVPQRITIRGRDVSNPILLRVHGGPGSAVPPVISRINGFDLEDLFTVCYWEQRGAGIAYTTDIPDSTITLNQIVSDGLLVTDYLRKKFDKEKIFIEGSSWGTAVSAFMVQENPEFFHAYIGIGQMANQPLSEKLSYDFAMTQAQSQNDTVSIRQLNKIGRPPYPNKSNEEMAEACNVQRTVVTKYERPRINADFSGIKALLLDNSMTFDEKLSPNQDVPAFRLLWPTCFQINLMRDIPKWEIPVYIMHGDNDHFTETSLAKAYFDSLEAPSKEWFLFEDATHPVQFEYPEKYRSIYIDEILR
ncbi:alpha/beta hydrolase [Cryomorphaceae bacterium 1068]|nr:alpha/beta hydrolase [Cryomorphaceae bacterium 1068]